MANLFDKLNILVQAGVKSVLNPKSRRKKTPSLVRVDQANDQAVATLRQQIDQALDDEERMTANILDLQHQLAAWDQQADQAVEQNDEVTARYAIHQMQLRQQQLTMLEAELAQHRRSTSELITHVNELEALIAEEHYRQQQQTLLLPDAVTPEQPAIERVSTTHPLARQPTVTAPPPETPTVDEKTIDDDLAQRRARLSR